MPQVPELLDEAILAETRVFTITDLHLRFSNGKERHFEKVSGKFSGAVMILPMPDDHTILLIREYAAAAGQYILGFPKGAIEHLEDDVLETANRELMEETGFGAKQLMHLAQWSLSPAYFNAMMEVVLAKDLYPKKLTGDEPEPIEVVPWRLDNVDALLKHPEFHESRSVAALLLLERMYR